MAVQMKNPIFLLLVSLVLQFMLLLTICLVFSPAQCGTDSSRTISCACLLLFLFSAAFSWLVGRSILRVYVNQNELVSAKLMAGMADNAQPGSVTELADRILKELESSQQREKLIADFSSDLLCCLTEDRKVLELNVQAEKTLGHSSMSLLANKLDSIVLPEDQSSLIGYFEQIRAAGSSTPTLECRVRRQSGELVDIEWQCEWSNSKQCFYCLGKDISDRKQSQRLKAEISAMITHDLRAPVTGVSYFLQSLEKGQFGAIPETTVGEIASVQEGIGRMLLLINQLMDAEKLEGGRMEADIKIVPLSEVYEYCKSMMTALAAKKDLALNFPESETLVFADYDQINQVFCNLVSNAIKYSPARSTIEVAEETQFNLVKVSVKDSGPGIPEELKAQIFERFKTCKNPDDKVVSGSSGLGLYLAKKLAELQGGNIGVKSLPGQGSTFWFTLRKASEADLPGYD